MKTFAKLSLVVTAFLLIVGVYSLVASLRVVALSSGRYVDAAGPISDVVVRHHIVLSNLPPLILLAIALALSITLFRRARLWPVIGIVLISLLLFIRLHLFQQVWSYFVTQPSIHVPSPHSLVAAMPFRAGLPLLWHALVLPLLQLVALLSLLVGGFLTFVTHVRTQPNA